MFVRAQEKETKNGGGVACSKDGDDDLPTDNNISDKENIDKQHSSAHEREYGSGDEETENESITTSKNTDNLLKTVSIDDTRYTSSSSLERRTSKGITMATTTTTTTACPASSSVVTTMPVYSPRSSDQPVAVTNLLNTVASSSPRRGKKEEGWKEVGKR